MNKSFYFFKMAIKIGLRKSSKMSRLVRLWHLSPTANSVFKYACTAIHWGYRSDFRSDPSSTYILYVCEQRRLWLPEPSLFAYAIRTIISWAGSNSVGCDRQLNAQFYSAASLKYHTPYTWHYATPSHIILTLARPVKALLRKTECQARSS